MYDPAEFASLPVSAEISELFQYITRYKPHNIELETKMRPFIPDYIPAVGEIDHFAKVRPHGRHPLPRHRHQGKTRRSVMISA